MTDFDVAIIGAGIAGASLAAELAGQQRILLLEAEAYPGYHATGRSAAFWTESYGGPKIQPLTSASGPFLACPPPDFSDKPLMTKRGAMYIGEAQHQSLAGQMLGEFAASGVKIAQILPAAIKTYLPNLRNSWSVGLYEPECCDIDVAGLHAAYLRQAKRLGAKLLCRAALQSAIWRDDAWSLTSGAGGFSAKILVNAAGAWADDIAIMAGVRPLQIKPYRRTIAQLRTRPAAPANLPLVIGLDGSFYFKPDTGGKLWLSPHDETLMPPCDAAPEEIDVARAIERFGQVVDCDIVAVEHKWAGLRSFAPDRLPVIGYDCDRPEFFWFAGQGGFGIQTAPASAWLAASLLSPDAKSPAAISAKSYSPARFR
mgnify:CR=1 FL=1